MGPMSVLAISLEELEPPSLSDIFGFFGNHPIIVVAAAIYLAYLWIKTFYDFYQKAVAAGRITKQGAAAVRQWIGTWRKNEGITSLVTRLVASALLTLVPLVWLVICVFIGNAYATICQIFYEEFTGGHGPETIPDPLALGTGAWILIIISLVAVVVTTGLMGWADEPPHYYGFVVPFWCAIALGLPAAIILIISLIGGGWHPMALLYIFYIAGFWLVPWTLWWAAWLCKLTSTPEKDNIIKRLIWQVF